MCHSSFGGLDEIGVSQTVPGVVGKRRRAWLICRSCVCLRQRGEECDKNGIVCGLEKMVAANS
jgi:hypothetical protein